MIIFLLHLLSSLTHVEQSYLPSWNWTDHGITGLLENHQYCSFNLRNQGISDKITVVVQCGCWTEEGALQIAWDKTRPWLLTLKTARGRQTPSAKGRVSRCRRAAVWPLCKLLARCNDACHRAPCEQQEDGITSP